MKELFEVPAIASSQPPMRKGSVDDFMTPPVAIQPLLAFMRRRWIVWEPACGTGNLVEAFRANDFRCIGTDVKTGHDFRTYAPDAFDCIVTNPPFSLKGEFLERAYALGKPFAFLLPLTTFEGLKRQALFRQHGVEVILFDRRINFETPSGKGAGSWFATAWFTHGLKIGRDLTFVKLPKAA